MRLRIFHVLLAGALFGASDGSAQVAAEVDDYAEAQAALAEGVRPVAVVKLRAFLAAGPRAAAAPAARQLLAETLVDEGRLEEATALLPNLSREGVALVQGRVALAENRWSEAAVAFQSSNSPLARAGLAEALAKAGRFNEAMAVLTTRLPEARATLRLAEMKLERRDAAGASELLRHLKNVPPAEASWQEYLQARVLLDTQQLAAAHLAFEELLRNGRRLSEQMLAGATLGLANVRVALSGPEAADNVIEDFIGQHPQSAYLDDLFRRLDQIYDQEESPSDNALEKWLRDEVDSPRRAFAEFYKARQELREKRTARALKRLAAFPEMFPEHPLIPQASLLRGQVLMKLGRGPEAVAMFDEAMRLAPDEPFRAETEMAAGAVQFESGNFLLAASLFQSAGQRSRRLFNVATYNAALAWLRQGNEPKFQAALATLRARSGTAEMGAQLWLERGLTQARLGQNAAAAVTLGAFQAQFPQAAQQATAEVARAELAWQEEPPQVEQANEYLRVANQAAVTPEDRERADYLAIFVADSATQRDEPLALERGESFLKKYPQSAHEAEVRMKLGEIYHRRGDFVNAQSQLETLSRTTPGSPLVESALYVAGQAAMQTMSADGLNHALELFEQVVKLNGPLRLYARQQQALVQLKLGREDEAVTIYDAMLTATPPPEAELQAAALLGKGKALFTRGAQDAGKYAAAALVLNQLASDPSARLAVRNEAAYLRGKCLEKQAQPDAALAAYYDLLQAQLKAEAGAAEYLWSFKAGFDAAGMLEAKQNWTAAIGVYEMMARIVGPRSEEAKRRADDLRLQHFIWDQ